MVEFLAIVLIGQISYQTFDVQLPNIVTNLDEKIDIIITGEVSNSQDPCLTIPKKIKLTNTYSFPIGSKDGADCSIEFSNQINKLNNTIKISVNHSHQGYDTWLDLTGNIHFKITNAGKVVEGDFELKQKPRQNKRRKLTELANPTDPPNVNNGFIDVMKINYSNYSYTSNYNCTPNKRYLVEFDYYLVGDNSIEYIFDILKYNNQPVKGNSKEQFKLNKCYDFKKRQICGRFSKIITTDICENLIIFRWNIIDLEDLGGTVFIRNDYITPLDNLEVKRGP